MNTPSLRLRWPLLVLLASMALTAIAAFDAQRAIRVQDRVVSQALNEVVNFASWSYGQHLQQQLGDGAREVLGAVNHGDNVHTGRNIPPANELVHYLYYSQQCLCHVPRRGPVPANFLAIKLGSDRLDVATNTYSMPAEGWRVDDALPEPLRAERQRHYTAAETRWIVDTLTTTARVSPPADRGYAYVLGKINGEPRIFAYTLMPTAWGDTLLYSAEYAKASFSRILAGVLDGSGLLPATFTRGKRNREVVTIRVADRAGNEIFSSGSESTSPAVSRLELPNQFDALALETHPAEPRHIVTVWKIGYRFAR